MKGSKAETLKVTRNGTPKISLFLKLFVPAIFSNASSSPTWCSAPFQQHAPEERGNAHTNPKHPKGRWPMGLDMLGFPRPKRTNEWSAAHGLVNPPPQNQAPVGMARVGCRGDTANSRTPNTRHRRSFSIPLLPPPFPCSQSNGAELLSRLADVVLLNHLVARLALVRGNTIASGTLCAAAPCTMSSRALSG